MKKLLLIATVVIGFTTATAFAQMSGGSTGGQGGSGGQGSQGGMMGAQQSQQMMGNQMMTQDMMRDMAGMMRNMNGMMDKMSGFMEHNGNMNHGKMMNMSKMMGEMSANMKDMSERMAQGKMDADHMKKMQGRMKSMDHTMGTIEKEEK